MKTYYVYMMQCNDGSFYTGYTNNIEKRVAKHQTGKGAKYTRARLPVFLVYFEEVGDKREALKREYQLRSLNHKEKERLVSQKNQQYL